MAFNRARRKTKSAGRKKQAQAKLRKEPSKASLLKSFFHSGAGVWLYEVMSVLSGIVALFFLISFLSYKFSGDRPGGYSGAAGIHENVMGPVGHVSATLLDGAMGWCGLMPSLWIGALAVYFWMRVENDGQALLRIESRLLLLAGLVGSMFACAGVAAVLGGRAAGGEIGSAIAALPSRFFGTGGSLLICSGLLLLFLGFSFQRSSGDIIKLCALGLLRALNFTLFTVPGFLWNVLLYGCEWIWSVVAEFGGRGMSVILAFLGRRAKTEDELELPRPKRRKNLIGNIELERAQGEIEELREVVVRRNARSGEAARKLGRQAERKLQQAIKQEVVERPYEPPSLALLTPGEATVGGEDDDVLKRKSRLIEAKLKDFGISGRVTHVHPGPVITLFEFEPAAGVKVGRIASLQDDLAMSLRASSIRIIAPIPRRGTVGIEVPNKQRDIVRLRDVLESEEFVNAESILSVPIGKNIYGEPLVTDVAKMPHFLMAGATGTGKSVSINSILVSLLYKASPAELGLILIDPKILELSVYDGIPHLRVPVVTVPKQAKAVLEWAVHEMNRRYRLMQRFGVRSIDGYNEIARGKDPDESEVVETGEGVVQLPEESIVEEGVAAPAEIDEVVKSIAVEEIKPLPKILIIIDELADLMFSVGREIEDLITRLAQKARASGIHLIVATQRPSVDVITGLIKANFPARMSFRVSSRVDSRTILDSIGAERLLGRGDMLLMLPGAEHVVRAHGAFVSDEEVRNVVKSVKENASPTYDPEIVAACERAMEDEQNGTSGGGEGEDEYDAFYDQAVELVVDKGQASTSMIQRAFRIGYNRAARIIDIMEQEGIVGPSNGAKPREIVLEGKEYD